MTQYLVGIDIGGTKLATVVADNNGTILHKVRQPTEAGYGSDYVVSKLIKMVDQTLALVEISRSQISAIGISCGGPLDTKTGIVYSPPNLPDWDAVPLKKILTTEFQVPTVIENDANASAYAEWKFGGGQGYDEVVFMTMSTGIGAGIVSKGQIYHGASDCAGEVGHQILIPNGPLCGCGNRGCLEAICSGPAIARRAQEAIQKQPETEMLKLAGGKITAVKSEHVVAAAQNGDLLAFDLIHQTAFYMGWGIANLVNIVNPEVVLIGTIAVAAGDLLLDPIRRTVQQMAMTRPAQTVRILPAKLGDRIGDLASISLVI
ncbi:MAG: ROK family protein [Candidatus Poribacteria bacterium]|jgi:glucokinase|nr:ROK family protein [Candidatus Poribacteria bacterium]MDP6745928.1 ROK family protein [Candidatus Poribacteria bacterium]MDP6995325.1 ROK family protein [Candidatus Poribacteria bacterium]